MALEALASAAMVLASHKSGIGSVAFPAFLSALLFQLGVTRTDEPTELPVVLNNKSGTGTANITVPFLSAPNVEWPLWLLEDWQSLGARLDNLHRTVNETRIDFRIGSGVISGECKDYSDALKIDVIKGILERIPDDSSIHIVVTNQLQDSRFNTEDPSDFIAQNCLEHIEFYRVLGPQRFEKSRRKKTRDKCTQWKSRTTSWGTA